MSQNGRLSDEAVARAAETLKALAHPLRLRILEFLDDGRAHCVGEIGERLGAAPSIVSQQLSLLRVRGLLAARRRGSHTYYTVADPKARVLLDCFRNGHAAAPAAAPLPAAPRPAELAAAGR